MFSDIAILQAALADLSDNVLAVIKGICEEPRRRNELLATLSECDYDDLMNAVGEMNESEKLVFRRVFSFVTFH